MSYFIFFLGYFMVGFWIGATFWGVALVRDRRLLESSAYFDRSANDGVLIKESLPGAQRLLEVCDKCSSK